MSGLWVFYENSVFKVLHGTHSCIPIPNPTQPIEWCATEKPTQPWPVVSLKDTMGTMGRDPQINEKDILGAGEFHSSAAKRANGVIFRIGILPSTRSIQKFNQNLMVL